MKCPGCGKETRYKGNPYRPFCSGRCKLVDLGRWVAEDYKIPTRTADHEEDGIPSATEDRQKT